MEEYDWDSVRVFDNVRKVVRMYSKIKKNFMNRSTVDACMGDLNTKVAINDMYSNLLDLKRKLKNCEKQTGLDKI